MKIITINDYQMDENTYLLFDENIKEAIVIDPGTSYDKIKNAADENGVKIKYVMVTHCHYDHIIGLSELLDKTGARLVSGDNASVNLSEPLVNLSGAWLTIPIKCGPSDIILSDGESMSFCGIEIKCIYTPGHTNCSVCYIAENNIFSGDTLFLRSIGRCDLPTGDGSVLEKSIKEKLYTLDDNMNVYPGHGNKTSIEYEKKFNMFIKL